MSRELTMLVASGLLSLLLALATIGIHFHRFGGKIIRGNRDGYPPVVGLAARVTRAHGNLNEALLPFAILVIAATSLHVSNAVTAYASIAFFAARVAHAAFYLWGATPWRSVSFYAGMIATIALATQLPLGS
jgi:uncharacterized MAPEG superfamily protein